MKHPPLEAETQEEKGEQDRKLIKGRRMNDSWVRVFWVGCQTTARDHTKVFRYDMVCVMKAGLTFLCCQASLWRECAWSEFVLLSATIVLVASRQVQTSGQRRDYCTEQTVTSSHTHTHTHTHTQTQNGNTPQSTTPGGHFSHKASLRVPLAGSLHHKGHMFVIEQIAEGGGRKTRKKRGATEGWSIPRRRNYRQRCKMEENKSYK